VDRRTATLKNQAIGNGLGALPFLLAPPVLKPIFTGRRAPLTLFLRFMSLPLYIDDSSAKKLIFYTGKGGVGKTTVVWSTAKAMATAGKKIAVAAWSDTEGRPAGFPKNVDWVPLQTMACFREYVLQVVRFEKLYDTVFDNKVLRTFVLAAPGLSDTVIAGKLWDLYKRNVYDCVLVDLPSSGHALSFFHSPLGVKRIFSVGFVHKETERICDMLAEKQVRVDLVALPEELPVVESLELKSRLEKLHPFHFGYLHLNQMLPDFSAVREIPNPSDLPAATQSLVGEYTDQWRRQKENLELARQAGLPILEIPRLPSQDEEELLQKVSGFLSTARPQ
jgi:hypothetical protein